MNLLLTTHRTRTDFTLDELVAVTADLLRETPFAQTRWKVTPVPDPYRTYTGTGNSFTVELTGAANGTHVLGNTDLMSAALGTGVRRDISSDPDLEVLMDAYGYTTPEPATLAFVAIGLASVVAARRRRRAA